MQSKATQILRRIAASFPEYDCLDDELSELNGGDAVERLGQLWGDIKTALYEDDDALISAFLMGYYMAQRDRETLNAYPDKNAITQLATMYVNASNGKSPL